MAAARTIPKFNAPGPAFDAGPARGKRVFYLAITFGVSIVETLYNGVKAAATAAGVQTNYFDAKGQPNLYLTGMNQAISQKYDLILVESIQNTLINEQIKQAHKAGIKVVLLNEEYQGGERIEPVDARVAFDYVGGAIMEANYVLADSSGKNINAVIFRAPSARHEQMEAAIRSQIHRYAIGGAKIQTQVVPFANFATQLPVLTRTVITADPSINYMIPVIDGMALYIIPSIHQANASGKVKVASYNGTPSILSFLKRRDTIIGDTGGANTWEGWCDMDQALRVLTGHAPVPGEEKPPNRAFDDTNIDSIDLNEPEALWYDTAKAEAGFKHLWGLA
jgi:ribose transport system substrate-binding protein